MSEKVNKNWSDEAVATLTSMVAGQSPVSADTVEQVAAALSKSTRSIAAKLRQLDFEVASLAQVKAPAFTPEEAEALRATVMSAAGSMTYKDIAAQFMGGKFNAKQIQGKLLAMELTSQVKPADKVEVARSYTEAEETKFISMANGGSFIEEISAALGKPVASVRGKALSLTRSGHISEIPKQKESHAKEVNDPVTALGDALATMTVEQIAAATDKTVRGLKTLLTRRGLDFADYKGKTKKEKAEAKAAA